MRGREAALDLVRTFGLEPAPATEKRKGSTHRDRNIRPRSEPFPVRPENGDGTVLTTRHHRDGT